MKRKYKTNLTIIGILIIILINLLLFWIGYQNYLYPKLGEFEIKNLKEENGYLVVETTPSHNAVSYEVILEKDGKKIYETTSNTSKIVLKDFEAEFNDKIKVNVIAKNKNDVEKTNKNEFYYNYKEATFQKEKDHLLSGSRDLTLFVLGYDYKKEYQVELYYGKNKIYDSFVSGEDITIPYQVVEGYSGKITAVLKNKNERITSSFNFYLNTPIVGKVEITSPNNDYKTRWNDVEIDFTGGKNANHFYANLYSNGNFLNKIEVENKKNKIKIPAEAFQEETNYQIVLEAVYDDFFEIAEKDEVNIQMGKKEATWGVYVSHNPTFIKQGTKVDLKTITKDAEIFYTIDGSDPITNGILYTTPLEIVGDTLLKTYAKSKNRYDSIMSSYSFFVKEKTPVIYLSPSNQDQNYGIESVGFTTEMAIMNQIADVVERELKNANMIVYRNKPTTDMNVWSNESRRVGADFHFAIHSNASAHHTARGPEIHVDNEYSLAYSIASNIYENLWNIYDGKENYTYHRGIKFTRGSLGEANDQYLPCASLIEVAFHDEQNDASWIMNNIESIGKNLASSIISYYN